MYIVQDEGLLTYMRTERYKKTLKEMDQMDFSSRSIVVSGDNVKIIDPEHISGSSEKSFLLEYETEADAKWAFIYYDYYCDTEVASEESVYNYEY